MSDYYRNKYNSYNKLYLSQQPVSKPSNATINAAKSSARRRHYQKQRELKRDLVNNAEYYSRPKQFRISDEITVLEFMDNPDDFGPEGQPDFYRARRQRSKDMWFGQLELENIKEDIARNCHKTEEVRIRGPLNKEKYWPTSQLTYTYPNSNCGKYNFQDREGNCWILAIDKLGPTLLKTDPITTPGPHNINYKQFRGLPKSKNKDVYTRRPMGVQIGTRHPER